MAARPMNGCGQPGSRLLGIEPTVFPSIRYAGRLAGDPAGSLDRARPHSLPARAHKHTHPAAGRLQRSNGDPLRRLHVLVHAGIRHRASAPDKYALAYARGRIPIRSLRARAKGHTDGHHYQHSRGAPIANATVSAGPSFATQM